MDNSKNTRVGYLIIISVAILIVFGLGYGTGKSKLLEKINKEGELSCENSYCTLYLKDVLEIGSDFQITRTR